MATVTIEWKTQIWIVWLSEWMVNLIEITFSESSQEVSKMELLANVDYLEDHGKVDTVGAGDHGDVGPSPLVRHVDGVCVPF